MTSDGFVLLLSRDVGPVQCLLGLGFKALDIPWDLAWTLDL